MWQKYSHVWCWYYAIFEDDTIKCEKKIWVQPNVAKVRSNVMLVRPNVTMEPTNVRKKIRELSNETKVQSYMMLVLHNFWGWYYQMWEKNTSTTEYGKSTVKCDVSIAQYDNETNKCEKKNKRTIECNKSIVICDVGIAQCDNGIVKCEEKIKVPLNVRKVQ